ncbi:DUF192 domain-containing protein [Marinobacter salicampi]|uniref:DUF192 domain-containing protein n=1 Tax=Marinobacter salicampi TaxID=435907 RepID=UPI001A951BA5|nr:DUF192 domain-containing protein [Marinobacter salicampi]
MKQRNVFARYPSIRLLAGQNAVIETYLARTWPRRFRGLLGKRALCQNEGLLLSPCRSIHTFGMPYAIDVVFLDEQARILAIEPHVQKGRVLKCSPAHATLELRSGAARRHGLQVGQCLREASIGQSLGRLGNGGPAGSLTDKEYLRTEILETEENIV